MRAGRWGQRFFLGGAASTAEGEAPARLLHFGENDTRPLPSPGAAPWPGTQAAMPIMPVSAGQSACVRAAMAKSRRCPMHCCISFSLPLAASSQSTTGPQWSGSPRMGPARSLQPPTMEMRWPLPSVSERGHLWRVAMRSVRCDSCTVWQTRPWRTHHNSCNPAPADMPPCPLDAGVTVLSNGDVWVAMLNSVNLVQYAANGTYLASYTVGSDSGRALAGPDSSDNTYLAVANAVSACCVCARHRLGVGAARCSFGSAFSGASNVALVQPAGGWPARAGQTCIPGDFAPSTSYTLLPLCS